MNATVMNDTAWAPRSAVLITGGAGFIGANLAHRLIERGCDVRVFDSFARAGVKDNVRWLRDIHGERVDIVSLGIDRKPFDLHTVFNDDLHVFRQRFGGGEKSYVGHMFDVRLLDFGECPGA